MAAYLLAGADVVMTTSSLLRHGAEHAVELLDGLQAWMERKGFESVEQVRGRLATAAGVRSVGVRATQLPHHHRGGDSDLRTRLTAVAPAARAPFRHAFHGRLSGAVPARAAPGTSP